MQFFSDKAESEVAVNRKKLKATQGCGTTNIFHLFYSRGYYLLMDNYTFAVLRSQGGRARKVCYENNNYRIQVWNVEIRREEGGEREHTWSLRQGSLVSSTLPCYDLSPAPTRPIWPGVRSLDETSDLFYKSNIAKAQSVFSVSAFFSWSAGFTSSQLD